MTFAHILLLVGLFGIPLVLLAVAYRLHRRGPIARGLFWGGVIGHTIGIVVASTASMYVAEEWTETDRVRGFLGYGSLVIGGFVGAAVGAFRARGRDYAGAGDRVRA